MRKMILAAAATLGTLAVTAPAAAQWGRGYSYDPNREYRQELRECRRELRHADSRREYRRERRECRRELREARRDARRYGHHRGYGYYDQGHYYPRSSYGYSNRRYWDGYAWRYRY